MSKGSLLIIGGHEDRNGDKDILERIGKHVQKHEGHLVLMPVATSLPDESIREYKHAFKDMGIKDIEVVDVRVREDALDPSNVDKVKGASAIFMTGGDQLRITSQIGDSEVFRTMRELFKDGAMIAGTSAGAAALSEVMVVSGEGDESLEPEDLRMAPGLDFVPDVIIDTHFAERGRINRLIAAVAQNPKHLGIGLDEDTAILLRPNNIFEVVGSHAVYVVDGMDISYSSLSNSTSLDVLSTFDVKLHILAKGYRFHLKDRQPIIPHDSE